jgi:hypothetical protein
VGISEMSPLPVNGEQAPREPDDPPEPPVDVEPPSPDDDVPPDALFAFDTSI